MTAMGQDDGAKQPSRTHMKNLAVSFALLCVSCVYAIKCNNDHKVSKLKEVRTCVHCVFEAGDPYGDVYAKISPCVPGSNVPVVPHIVQP